jgi:hypothetical protein
MGNELGISSGTFQQLNPKAPPEVIDAAVTELTRDLLLPKLGFRRVRRIEAGYPSRMIGPAKFLEGSGHALRGGSRVPAGIAVRNGQVGLICAMDGQSL